MISLTACVKWFCYILCIAIFSLCKDSASTTTVSKAQLVNELKQQITTTKQDPSTASIQAQISKNDQLEIRVAIPANSHAYLDKGKEGNLIPITFDWQTLVNKGSLSEFPRLVAAPKGQYDKKVEATVLRGEGLFVFASKKTNTLSSTLAGEQIRIRTQICDEVEGICYRPKWTQVVIANVGAKN